MDFVKLRFAVLSSRCLGKFIIKLKYAKYSAFTSNRWGGDSFDNEIQRNFSIFLKGEEINDSKLKEKLKVDIIWSYYRYGATPIEYFLFKFNTLSDHERKSYLTVKQKDDLCKKTVDFKVFLDELENKYNFYSKLKSFYKREAFLLTHDSDRNDFEKFFSKCGVLFFKPLEGQCGEGTHIEKYDRQSFSIQFDRLVSNGQKWMVEELIKQDEATSIFNKSSVNTVRVNTFRTNKGIEVFTCFMRVGRDGAVCDNGGAGGLLIQLNDSDGKIVSDAYDEVGNVFENHPDSHIHFKGVQIPHWDKLIETAKAAHEQMTNHKFIGWDFALSNNDWVLVEGNWGAFISQQLTRGYGLRKVFEELMNS